MMAGGIDQRSIADALGIARNTMRAHYRSEIKSGAVLATANVIASLYRHATGDDPRAAVAACKFWLQAREGWSERAEYSGPGGKPQHPPQSYVVRMPSPVESVEQWMETYVPKSEREPI
jgi:hypothetical protein